MGREWMEGRKKVSRLHRDERTEEKKKIRADEDKKWRDKSNAMKRRRRPTLR